MRKINTNTQKVSITTTKRGFPAMWESGGGMTSGGSATIVTGRNGEARRPIFIPRGGHLSCGNHALIGVGNGFHIINASVRRGERSSASIQRILSTSIKDIDGERFEATAEVETVNSFSLGEWDKPLDEKFAPAVEAAFKKSGSYHCRSPYFIDYSDRPERSAEEKRRNDERALRQEAERAAKREAKAEREAREKAEREACSAAAKVAGLGDRLEALNEHLTSLGHKEIQLDEVSFRWGWQTLLYSEENVERIERHVAGAKAKVEEKEQKRLVREAFQPQFETFTSRAEAIGQKITFSEDSVRLDCSWDTYSYSDEGVANFAAKITQKEEEKIQARLKVKAEELYQERKAQAIEANLPQDIEIWKRVGSATNLGNGWVIGRDGMDRAPTSMYNQKPRRLQRYGEGYMIWEQILEGEVVLQWTKEYTAAEHVFDIIHLPAELTPAQLERIAEIEKDLAKEWDDCYGMSSGKPSPSVGGWNIVPPAQPTQSPSFRDVEEGMQLLKNRFGKR